VLGDGRSQRRDSGLLCERDSGGDWCGPFPGAKWKHDDLEHGGCRGRSDPEPPARARAAVALAGFGGQPRRPVADRRRSPYSPPKQGRGNPVRVKGGGFVDQDGNVWEWARPGQQHGGPHWDVQHPDGSHTNVAPDGTVIGKDNFPNKRRVPAPPPPPPEGSGDGNTAKIVGGAAVVAAGAGLVWWLGKLASPLCGPAVIVCGFVF
jgi:hypothetical protein